MPKKQIFFLGLLLFFLLASIYTAFYWGVHFVIDEQFLFDSTESLVRRGNFRLTYTYDLRATNNLADGEPWPLSAHEPLMPILAAPLFYLAQSVPSIGLMHTVWLFNIIITAATGVLVFYGGLILGYRTQSSWITALLFGIATIALPYARTFFREPLVGFFLLACYLSLYNIRQTLTSHRRIPPKSVIIFIVCFIAMFLTKVASLLFVPGLLILISPSWKTIKSHRNKIIGLSLAAVGAFVVFNLIVQATNFGTDRFSLQTWQNYTERSEAKFILQSSFGYQISPGRSFWLYSPILLLTFPGLWLLKKSGQDWRLGLSVISSALLIGPSYGILQNSDWWGGYGWGPRQLLPLVPVAILLIIPIIDRFFTFSHIYQWGIIALVGISILFQLLSMTIPIPVYYVDATLHNVSLTDLNWSIQWSPIPRHVALMDIQSPAIGWLHGDQNANIALILIAIALIASVWGAWRLLKNPENASPLLNYALSLGIFITLGLGLAFGIYSLKSDERYFETADQEAVMALIDQLNDTVQPDEAVFIEELNYQQAFLNYFKVPALTVTLPFAPGETFNPTLAASLADQPYSEQLGIGTPLALNWAADHYNAIWLVVSKSQPMNLLRPTEHFLAENNYPIEAENIHINDLTRAVKIYTTEDEGNHISTSFRFGENLILNGVNLPQGTSFSHGDVMPISLFWEVREPLGVDYIVSVQISDINTGVPIVQRDGIPQSTFGLTSQWQPGHVYQDNYGLRLPNDPNMYPAGQYRLQVIVYTYPDNVRLPVTGENNPESDIAVITPITIE